MLVNHVTKEAGPDAGQPPIPLIPSTASSNQSTFDRVDPGLIPDAGVAKPSATLVTQPSSFEKIIIILSVDLILLP